MYPDKRHMTARSQGTEHNIVENQGNTHQNAACNVYSLSVQCVQIVHAMCTDRDLRCVQIATCDVYRSCVRCVQTVTCDMYRS